MVAICRYPGIIRKNKIQLDKRSYKGLTELKSCTSSIIREKLLSFSKQIYKSLYFLLILLKS